MKGILPMASIENKDIIEVGDVDPIICRNINVNSIYSFQSILIVNCRLFWLPPVFNQLSASKVAIFKIHKDEIAT
jgi:hypothetical protein